MTAFFLLSLSLLSPSHHRTLNVSKPLKEIIMMPVSETAAEKFRKL